MFCGETTSYLGKNQFSCSINELIHRVIKVTFIHAQYVPNPILGPVGACNQASLIQVDNLKSFDKYLKVDESFDKYLKKLSNQA